jgi:hypothetical protein
VFGLIRMRRGGIGLGNCKFCDFYCGVCSMANLNISDDNIYNE